MCPRSPWLLRVFTIKHWSSSHDVSLLTDLRSCTGGWQSCDANRPHPVLRKFSNSLLWWRCLFVRDALYDVQQHQHFSFVVAPECHEDDRKTFFRLVANSTDYSHCSSTSGPLLCSRPHMAEALRLSDDARLTSDDVWLSVAYSGPKSRTERPRKTKIGTEVAHVTRDSDSTFKVKRSTCRGGGILWRPPAQLIILASAELALIETDKPGPTINLGHFASHYIPWGSLPCRS